jgi:hypothetical protein
LRDPTYTFLVQGKFNSLLTVMVHQEYEGAQERQGAQRERRPTVKELNDGIVKAKANLGEVMLTYSCVRIQAIVRGAVARQKFAAHRHDIERKLRELKLSPSDRVKDCYDYVMWMSILPSDQVEKGGSLGLASPRQAPGSSSSSDAGAGAGEEAAAAGGGGGGPTTAQGGGGRQRARFDARIIKVLLPALVSEELT